MTPKWVEAQRLRISDLGEEQQAVDWRAGSIIKSIDCSFRGRRKDSEHKLATIFNSSFRESSALFRPLDTRCTNIGKTPIYINLKKEKFQGRRYS